jgi:hypothetical protein
MFPEAVAALAGAGGTALVSAMATDAWQGARDGVGRLFRRGGEVRQAAIEAQLDEDADTLVRAKGSSDEDAVRQELVPVWSRRLSRLLEEHPDAEADVRVLINELHRDLPSAQQSWVQTNIVRDNSTQFAVQGGNINVHQVLGKQIPPADGDAETS